jgi:hypothetical protein
MSHPTAFRPRHSLSLGQCGLANASSSPSKTMQLHVGLAILFRGLANSSLAIHLLHAL